MIICFSIFLSLEYKYGIVGKRKKITQQDERVSEEEGQGREGKDWEAYRVSGGVVECQGKDEVEEEWKRGEE